MDRCNVTALIGGQRLWTWRCPGSNWMKKEFVVWIFPDIILAIRKGVRKCSLLSSIDLEVMIWKSWQEF